MPPPTTTQPTTVSSTINHSTQPSVTNSKQMSHNNQIWNMSVIFLSSSAIIYRIPYIARTADHFSRVNFCYCYHHYFSLSIHLLFIFPLSFGLVHIYQSIYSLIYILPFFINTRTYLWLHIHPFIAYYSIPLLPLLSLFTPIFSPFFLSLPRARCPINQRLVNWPADQWPCNTIRKRVVNYS